MSLPESCMTICEYECFFHGPMMVCQCLSWFSWLSLISWFTNVYQTYHRLHHFWSIMVIVIVIRLSWSCYVMSCWILDPWKSSGNLWPRRRRLSSSPSAPPARPISHRPSRRKLRTAFRLEPPHPMGQRHRKRRTTLVTVDDRFKDRCLEYLRISKVNS